MKAEFYTALHKVQQFGNTRSILIGALEENTNFIDSLFDEFKKTLSITETNIYKQFVDIEVATSELTETLTEPERRAESVLLRIDKLHPNIRECVLDALIKDNDNIDLIINDVINGIGTTTRNEKDKWKRVKIMFNDKLIEYKRTLPKETDKKIYNGIAESLSHYIKGATDSDITIIIDTKQQPPYKNKFNWIGSKSDAIHFCGATELKVSEFNKCFNLSDKSKLLHSNKSKAEYQEIEIINILKEYNLEKPPILAK